MPSPDQDDSSNPYRATFIDEKPVDAAEFFRAEPEYRKLTPGSVGRTSYAMFMQHKWQFIALGIFNGVFILFPGIAVFWLLAQHPDVGREQPWLPIAVAICLILLAVFMIVVSISVSLRILRKEKMVFLSTPRDAARLVWSMLHTLIYLLVLFGWLELPGLASNFVFPYLVKFKISSNWSILQLIFNVTFWIMAAFGIIFFIALIIIIVYVFARLFYGVHFIVDRQMNCLAAARASWRYTHHGNLKMITWKKNDRQNAHFFVLLVLCFLTGGTCLAGYVYCEVAVSYLMLTGQCELLEELPDEW